MLFFFPRPYLPLPAMCIVSSAQHAGRCPTLRLPARGLHSRTFLPHRLSIFWPMWPAPCYFSLIILKVTLTTLIFSWIMMWSIREIPRRTLHIFPSNFKLMDYYYRQYRKFLHHKFAGSWSMEYIVQLYSFSTLTFTALLQHFVLGDESVTKRSELMNKKSQFESLM